MSVLGRAIRPSHVLTPATVLLLAISGCGGGSETEAGAVVHVYVSKPLCAEARDELAHHGHEAGDVTVGVVCLPDAAAAGGRLDLARAGADARRATEDSTAVAFLAPAGRERSFAEPILEEAEIALMDGDSGAQGMARVFGALESRGDEAPRAAVWNAL